MEAQTELGTNRTGLQMSSKANINRMLEITGLTEPSSDGDESAIAEVRSEYIEAADPVGTVPLPGTAKGALKTAAQALKGRKAHVLIDKLGERLAFERTGTRVYEALITKCESSEDTGVIDVDVLRQFCEQEADHFAMLADCIESLGADPTAQTPGADVAGVASSGLLQVVSDPKTTVLQSLHAILIAELVDNAGWEGLIALVEDAGLDELAARFRTALGHEHEHLARIRSWHEQATLEDSRLVG
jgi:bacterioferritin (cytochrome b1)